MPFAIPDKGAGTNDLQSILFSTYLDVLSAGLQGVDCVVSGCAVTGAASMTPSVAAGVVISNGTWFSVSAGTVTISAADATNPRLDLIVVNSAGTKAVRTGTAAAAPKPPARTANDVVLAVAYVPANDTTITTDQITDLRIVRDDIARAPVIIRADATRTFTSNTAQQAIFNSPTNGRLTLDVGTYVFECLISMDTMSATSGNGKFSLNNGGTATLGAILYMTSGMDAALDTLTALSGVTEVTATQVATNIATAATATVLTFFVKGTFEVTGAGNIVPSFAQTTASAAVVKVGSYFQCRKVSNSTSLASVGLWD